MEINTLPTKGNLMAAKNTLKMSKLGYDLMDKKRNVLIREIMELNARAEEIQDEIQETFTKAYEALQMANIQMGVSNVELICFGSPIEDTVTVKSRSVMGVEIPIINYDALTQDTPFYGMLGSSTMFDESFKKFNKVKELTMTLAMIENAAYRLAVSIKKTQKRANSLKNITIPKYEGITKYIQETLEERERDEFTRLKVIKNKQ